MLSYETVYCKDAIERGLPGTQEYEGDSCHLLYRVMDDGHKQVYTFLLSDGFRSEDAYFNRDMAPLISELDELRATVNECLRFATLGFEDDDQRQSALDSIADLCKSPTDNLEG